MKSTTDVGFILYVVTCLLAAIAIVMLAASACSNILGSQGTWLPAQKEKVMHHRNLPQIIGEGRVGRLWI
jgi:hypothetical protein